MAAVLVLPAAVSADTYVGGLTLSTDQAGIVSGGLYVDARVPGFGPNVITKTFTLPETAVGNVTWARLYVSAYCGHMENDYAFTVTNSFDGDGDSSYEQVWPETGHAGYTFITNGGNDNSVFTGHGYGEPYKMINDHENRVSSDYFMWYDVTNLIAGRTVNVNVDTTGSYDGRIKVITLMVAYNDGDSDQYYYWVNDGHDVDSYYDSSYVGSTVFDLSSFTGTAGSATLTANHMASSDANYWFNGGAIPSDPATGNGQGSYSGYNIWDVTSEILSGTANDFQYDGTGGYYKIPLVTLVVKKEVSAEAPVARFAADVVTPDVGQTITFTDQSTNTSTSWVWTIEGTEGTDYQYVDSTSSVSQNPHVEFLVAGTYDVTLVAANAGGSDEEIKEDYITVNAVVLPDLEVTFVTTNPPYYATGSLFAREPNTVRTTVKNNGTAVSPESVLRITASDGFTGTGTIPALAPGETIGVDIGDATIRPMQDVTVTYTATADPDNLITEMFETNNIKNSRVLTVVYNGYKGKALYWDGGSNVTTYRTYDLRGNLIHSFGDSVYRSGSFSGGWTTFDTNWMAINLTIPLGATVREARLYVPYTWDNTNTAASVTLDFNGIRVPREDWFTDKANFGEYSNYTYGLMTYDVTGQFLPNDLNTATFTRSGSLDKISTYGFTLAVVYEDPAMTRKQIFLNEEFDLLGASPDAYATTQEEATAYVPFSDMTVDTGIMQSATLVTFVPSGYDYEGNLLYNGNVIASNVWNFDCGIMCESPSPFVAVDTRDVKQYLQPAGNTFGIQGTDDSTDSCMAAAQQFLVVEYQDAPVAGFSATPVTGPEPLTLLFTDESLKNPTSRVWDFGDGNSSWSTTETTFAHTYEAAGTYDVTLAVENSVGSDSEVKDDYITVTAGIVALPGFTNPPTDPDSDGLYEDLNANGRSDFNDVYLFYKNMAWMSENEPIAYFDFNGNGRLDFNDLFVLYKEMV